MAEQTLNIDLDEITHSAYDRLVAVEPHDDGTGVLFRRTENGEIQRIEERFFPWILASREDLFEELEGVQRVERLHGEGMYCFCVYFQNIKYYRYALNALKKKTGHSMSDIKAPYRAFNDLEQQFLTTLSSRLFRGLTFDHIRRLQLDIETVTTPGYDFPSAARAGDEIVLVSLRDNTGWECCLGGHDWREEELLRETVRCIVERDPDVIEGHNVFDFDLSYIEKRCARYDIAMNIGRDRRPPATRSSGRSSPR